MQRCTIFFITGNAVHHQRFSNFFSSGDHFHYSECPTDHPTLGIIKLIRPALNRAVAASKLYIYQILCVQFWAPDDGRRNRMKLVEHWQ